MSNRTKKFEQGIGLEPIDIPANPNEGDLYVSDGTVNPSGLNLRQNNAWISIGEASNIEGSELVSTEEDADKILVTDGADGFTYEDRTPTMRKQTNFLQSNIVASATGPSPTLNDLVFVNLDPDKVYQVHYQFFLTSDTDGFKTIECTLPGSPAAPNTPKTLFRVSQEVNPAGSGTMSSLIVAGVSEPFKVSSEPNRNFVSFVGSSFNDTDTLVGDGTRQATFVTLVELPCNLVETTDFSL